MITRNSAVLLAAMALLWGGCQSDNKVIELNPDGNEQVDASGRGETMGGRGDFTADDALSVEETHLPEDVGGGEDLEGPFDVAVAEEVAGDLCCYGDFMCPEGLHCVGGMPGGMPGTCVPPAPEGHCWEDEECGEGEACLEAKLCECTAGCMDPNGPISGECAVPACETESLDISGLGRPCPTGLECDGFGADLCSVHVLSAPDLPAFCTTHCASDLVDCGPDAFCLPMGYSSICVPNTCYDPFVHTCNNDSQCKIGSNWVGCCVCPEAVTTMELELEECLFEGVMSPQPFPLYCNNDCDGDELCEECPSPPGVECKDHQCVFTAVQ